MSWIRFHYHCRMLKMAFANDIDLSIAHESIKTNPISNEFGRPIKPKSLQDSILLKLVACEEHNKMAIQSTLEIYSKVSLSSFAQKPHRIRRVGYYLTYLTIMFFIMSGIYLFFVAPIFAEFFNSSDIAAPTQFILFLKFRYIAVLLLSFSMILPFFISKTIKDLFNFNKEENSSIIYKYLIPKKLKIIHDKIVFLIKIPMHITELYGPNPKGDILDYFKENNFSAKEIANEISTLVSLNVDLLIKQSELYLNIIYTITALILIFVIGQFIVSVYSPLFVLGNVI